MTVQFPLDFEFNGSKTFSDFYSIRNQEIIEHLQNSAAGSGEPHIFLWAAAGQGKTHLLQACCQFAHQHHRRSFYLALEAQNLPDPVILQGLEGIDCVCIDNIHHLAGNKDWEYEFLFFFNRLRDQGQHLILASSCPVNELPVALPDLKTRLGWGLSLRIQPYTEDEKMSLFTFKARQLGIEIAPQVSRYLLSHWPRDLPSLWSLLEKLDHETLAAQRKLTIPFVKQALGL